MRLKEAELSGMKSLSGMKHVFALKLLNGFMFPMGSPRKDHLEKWFLVLNRAMNSKTLKNINKCIHTSSSTESINLYRSQSSNSISSMANIKSDLKSDKLKLSSSSSSLRNSLSQLNGINSNSMSNPMLSHDRNRSLLLPHQNSFNSAKSDSSIGSLKGAYAASEESTTHSLSNSIMFLDASTGGVSLNPAKHSRSFNENGNVFDVIFLSNSQKDLSISINGTPRHSRINALMETSSSTTKNSQNGINIINASMDGSNKSNSKSSELLNLQSSPGSTIKNITNPAHAIPSTMPSLVRARSGANGKSSSLPSSREYLPGILRTNSSNSLISSNSKSSIAKRSNLDLNSVSHSANTILTANLNPNSHPSQEQEQQRQPPSSSIPVSIRSVQALSNINMASLNTTTAATTTPNTTAVIESDAVSWEINNTRNDGGEYQVTVKIRSKSYQKLDSLMNELSKLEQDEKTKDLMESDTLIQLTPNQPVTTPIAKNSTPLFPTLVTQSNEISSKTDKITEPIATSKESDNDDTSSSSGNKISSDFVREVLQKLNFISLSGNIPSTKFSPNTHTQQVARESHNSTSQFKSPTLQSKHLHLSTMSPRSMGINSPGSSKDVKPRLVIPVDTLFADPSNPRTSWGKQIKNGFDSAKTITCSFFSDSTSENNIDDDTFEKKSLKPRPASYIPPSTTLSISRVPSVSKSSKIIINSTSPKFATVNSKPNDTSVNSKPVPLNSQTIQSKFINIDQEVLNICGLLISILSLNPPDIIFSIPWTSSSEIKTTMENYVESMSSPGSRLINLANLIHRHCFSINLKKYVQEKDNSNCLLIENAKSIRTLATYIRDYTTLIRNLNTSISDKGKLLSLVNNQREIFVKSIEQFKTTFNSIWEIYSTELIQIESLNL